MCMWLAGTNKQRSGKSDAWRHYLSRSSWHLMTPCLSLSGIFPVIIPHQESSGRCLLLPSPLHCSVERDLTEYNIISHHINSYHIVSYHIISHDNSVATLGVLTVIVKAWFYFEVVSYVRAGFECFWWLLQRKSSFIFCFRRKSRTKRCPRRPLFRRSRFTSAPCSLFELCPFCVAGVASLGHFEV
jgi:hypothetical protein